MVSTVPVERSVEELETIARRLRRHALSMIFRANSGHPGGSLSAAEIVTALYFRVLRHDPQNPGWPDRDRFIISKGHGVPIVYAAMAECGYFPVDELQTLRAIDTRVQGHPSVKDLPGIEASTGSLGQGLSIGIGMALAGRLDGKDYRVYVLLGDGETEEGQVWEAAMAAGHFKLANLTAILDYNKFQLDGALSEIVDPAPEADKWRAFGWNVIEVDGHDMEAVLTAFADARGFDSGPTIIIAHTVKGKGVSFMENNNEFHGKAPTEEQYRQAMSELDDAER